MGKKIFLTISLLLFTFVTCYSQDCKEGAEPQSEFDSLPIFKVEPATLNPSAVGELSEVLTGQATPLEDVKSSNDKFFINFGSSVIEVYRNTGGVWFTDKARMWNPKLTPVLPNNENAKHMADTFFSQIYRRQLRELNTPLVTTFSNVGKTLTARYDVKTKARTDKQLDIQINYDTKVKVRSLNGQPVLLPVVGGGNEFNFTFGDKNKLISHSGIWREVRNAVKEAKVIPKAESDKRFKELMGKVKLESFTSYIAYYSAPPFKEQKFLFPVYVYHSTIKIDNEITSAKIMLLPATDFKPAMKGDPSESSSIQAQGPRPDDDTAALRPGSTDPEGDDTADAAREVGISWITVGLKHSESEAEDFLNELTSAGWVKNFDWGDDNAHERDWNANDDMWVDAADFVYYSGHASKSSWDLSVPDNGQVKSCDLRKPGEWGNKDVEWIIISACGPLHDDRLNGIGSVFTHWACVFDGLHQLLGFGASVYDYGFEGQKVAEYMKGGDTIINSWFRTAREVQDTCNGLIPPDGPNIWAGVIYAEQANQTDSPFSDHLWSVGTVAPDPKSPDVIIAMWTTT